MIAVIADDITGAAEIAGIGYDYGLNVLLTRNVSEDVPECDMLVLITNTRSMSKDEAVRQSLKIGAQLTSAGITHIYKKTDSVLRGHVAAELQALMQATGKRSALLLPANPSMNRRIVDGVYYVGDFPITQTPFSYDPEFPAKSDSVLGLLGCGILIQPEDYLPEQKDSIFIGNVSSEDELKEYSRKITTDVLPAGGGNFFKAYLQRIFPQAKSGNIVQQISTENLLVICGSTIRHNTFIGELQSENIRLCNMPSTVYHGRIAPRDWINGLVSSYSLSRKLGVVIDHPVADDPAYPLRLKKVMAEVCKAIIDKEIVNELVIEGGATAYEVMEVLDWHTFEVVGQIAHGIIRLRPYEVSSVIITLKPGSYQWPAHVLMRK